MKEYFIVCKIRLKTPGKAWIYKEIFQAENAEIAANEAFKLAKESIEGEVTPMQLTEAEVFLEDVRFLGSLTPIPLAIISSSADIPPLERP